MLGRSQEVRQRVLVPRPGVRILPPQPGGPPPRPGTDTTNRMSIGAVVLAAGQGTRMRSSLPKVVHPLAGRPMVSWVLDALDGGRRRPHRRRGRATGPTPVREVLPAAASTSSSRSASWAPATRRGSASPRSTPGCDTVVVACGDTPLLRAALIGRMVAEQAAERAGRHHASPPASTTPAPTAAWCAAADGTVARIVEARDASPEELAIGEFNAGLYAFDRAALEAALGRARHRPTPRASCYLTDALDAARRAGGAPRRRRPRDRRGGQRPGRAGGLRGGASSGACASELMRAGVTMPDPAAVYLDAGVGWGRTPCSGRGPTCAARPGSARAAASAPTS